MKESIAPGGSAARGSEGDKRKGAEPQWSHIVNTTQGWVQDFRTV